MMENKTTQGKLTSDIEINGPTKYHTRPINRSPKYNIISNFRDIKFISNLYQIFETVFAIHVVMLQKADSKTRTTSK